MKILWFSWKDMSHPQAGGAEVVNEELAKRLAAQGHEVHFIVGGYDGCSPEEDRDGFKITRVGSKYTVYWHAFRFYKSNLQGWADLVVDEMNTIPFFARWYVREKSILFVHQLAREVWWYQMVFPFSFIGYTLEPLYLFLLRKYSVVTISESTKNDLLRYGFHEKNISIISEGIEIDPVVSISIARKYNAPTILSLGSVRPMKQTLEIIHAFTLIYDKMPDARLIIAGDISGSYGELCKNEIEKSSAKNAIKVLGRVSKQEKIELLRQSHVLVVTSIKEGWGLVVTEANSQGTPAVVYNVDGLRDSVKDAETGLVTTMNTPQELARKVTRLLQDKEMYERYQKNAYEWSKCINFERSYEDFIGVIKNI